ncbi:MAG TPA: hypothetical protein PK225_07210 [Azonexus sp.]|jgi:hypothetical protein|nr:hypothetical protein [Azonexus sp.]
MDKYRHHVSGLFAHREEAEGALSRLVDGAVGTAVGAGIGALAQLALVAGSVSLFVASPLVMLGWGARLGAFVGAEAGVNAGFEQKIGGCLTYSVLRSPAARSFW